MTIEKSYISISPGQLHFRTRPGGPDLPIIFLHQTASSSAMYLEVMKRLGDNRPLYALDTPGFGGSDDVEGFPSISDYAGWIIEAIDALGITDFHLFGHHTGSCIGVEIAAALPDRVKSLMMVGPVPLTDAERQEFSKHYREPISPTVDGSYLLDTWTYVRTLGGYVDADLKLHHRETVDMLRAYYSRFQIYSAVWQQDFNSYYVRVKCPIMNMTAPGDVLDPYFDRAQEIRRDAVAVKLKGHNFEPDEDVEGTVAAIENFTAKLP
jgi:pimeloyl-ACP methyl ester carboxylesterase